MRKLVEGIVDFRKNDLPKYRKKFSYLARGQAPDTLFIACSDSRVVPNLFASTDPGDLFVVRNVGNLVPPCCETHSTPPCHDKAEAAAIEFAVLHLHVSDIIVCGHSECGAMKAILDGRESISSPYLRDWLYYGEEARSQLKKEPGFAKELSTANRVSQLNVLLQLEHLKSYPVIQTRIQKGELNLHGWWFELEDADVYTYEEASHQFVLLDEKKASSLLQQIEKKNKEQKR